MILLVSLRSEHPDSGGGIAENQSAKMLFSIFGRANVLHFPIPRPSVMCRIRNILLQEGWGGSAGQKRRFREILRQNKIEFVFFNCSLYSDLVEICHELSIPSIVRFQNVESIYFREMAASDGRWSTRIYQKYITAVEKKTVLAADKLIPFTDRDSQALQNLYGRAADGVIPLTLDDENGADLPNIPFRDGYCLFVGCNMFANVDGMRWFAREVAPFLPIRTVVAGTVCRSLSASPNLELRGWVDDLPRLYAGASCVVSPIFSGSGMKTRTVEALKFGKWIFGTQEAFAGIDDSPQKLGALCRNAEDFITEIKKYAATPCQDSNNSAARRLFHARYTPQSCQTAWRSIFNEK